MTFTSFSVPYSNMHRKYVNHFLYNNECRIFKPVEITIRSRLK
jgi:hypothetical protein